MKDYEFLDRSMDYYELKYDTEDVTIANSKQMIYNFPLVRFLKTLLMLTVDFTGDTDTVMNFIQMLYEYDYLCFQEKTLLEVFQKTLSKEKTNA